MGAVFFLVRMRRTGIFSISERRAVAFLKRSSHFRRRDALAASDRSYAGNTRFGRPFLPFFLALLREPMRLGEAVGLGKKISLAPHFPLMRALFLIAIAVLSLIARESLAVNSTFRALPNVFIRPPFPDAKSFLTDSFLVLDTDNQLFYSNFTIAYADSSTAQTVVQVETNGYVSFTAEQEIFFSFENSLVGCRQNAVGPSICSTIMSAQSGPWRWGNREEGGSTLWLVIETSSQYIDPATGQPANYLGAQQSFTYACDGTCAALTPLVPRPQNVSYMVPLALQ